MRSSTCRRLLSAALRPQAAVGADSCISAVSAPLSWAALQQPSSVAAGPTFARLLTTGSLHAFAASPALCSSVCSCQVRQHRLLSTSSAACSSKEQGSSEASSDKQDKAEGAAQGKDDGASSSGSDSEAQPSIEQLLGEVKEKEEAMAKLNAQVEKLTDAVKRSLAEMENVRARTTKEVENAKKFALQKFVMSLLDVPDNLERACSVVSPDVLAEGSNVSADKLRATLKGLLEGVQATENIMLKVLKQHGVERYDPMGQKFDPNLHAALFEMPDPTKEAGTVASVTKRGYTLNERVIRPAEVGVVRQG